MAQPCSRPLGKSKDGLCDLFGGVWEWLEDAPPAEEVEGGEESDEASDATAHPTLRFVRGGGWRSPAAELTISHSRPSAGARARPGTCGVVR